MLTRILPLLILITASAVATYGQSPEALAAPISKAIRSDRLFGDPKYELEYKAATYTKINDQLWVVVGKRTERMLGGNQEFSLWVLNASGEKAADVPFATLFSVLEQTQETVVKVNGVVSLDSGDIVICANSSRGGVLLLQVDARTHHALKGSRVKLSGRNWVVTKALSTGDGNLFLLGRNGEKAAVAKSDPFGNVAWEKSIESKNVDVAVDGLVTEWGGLTILGDHVDLSGTYHLWLGNFTATGAAQAEATLAGHFAGLTNAVNGGIAAVHDVAKSQASTVVFDRFDRNLQKLRSTEIILESKATSAFQVARRSRAEFLVAGPDDEGLWLGLVADDGNLTSVYRYRDNSAMSELIWNCGIVPLHDRLIVIATVLRADNSRVEQRQMLRVLSIALK